jgi:hypothetical protein
MKQHIFEELSDWGVLVITGHMMPPRDLSKACVWKFELWRHADDEPSRENAVERLVKMLKDLIAKAEDER